jgi:hypothetical protein
LKPSKWPREAIFKSAVKTLSMSAKFQKWMPSLSGKHVNFISSKVYRILLGRTLRELFEIKTIKHNNQTNSNVIQEG